MISSTAIKQPDGKPSKNYFNPTTRRPCIHPTVRGAQGNASHQLEGPAGQVHTGKQQHITASGLQVHLVFATFNHAPAPCSSLPLVLDLPQGNLETYL